MIHGLFGLIISHIISLYTNLYVLHRTLIYTGKPLTWPDNWTATTMDGKRSVQFEHTLLITKNGVEALTGKIETSKVQFWEIESSIQKGPYLGSTPEALKRAKELSDLSYPNVVSESLFA